MFVSVQEPVLGGLIITAEEVRIFLLLACFNSPGGHVLKSFWMTKLHFLFYNPNKKLSFYLFPVNSPKHLVPLPWPNKQSAHCCSVGQLETVYSFC